jgi:hypothetical protein
MRSIVGVFARVVGCGKSGSAWKSVIRVATRIAALGGS